MVAVSSGDQWDINRVAGSLGAEIRNLDLRSVSDTDVAAIKKLLNEHMVLFFPGQRLTEESHIELGRKFGDLEAHPNLIESVH